MAGISMGKNWLNGLLAALLLMAMASIALQGSAMALDWDKYEPVHSPGSGESDWWTTYPSQSTKAGSSVEHPDWVLDALLEKPVLILAHSSNCKSCVVQMANMEKVLASYGKNVTYYDILADGSDQRAFEVLGVYGLTGNYVPTTVFITLAKGSDGKVTVAWHSAEDAMSGDQINSYVEDSIHYYRLNAAEWS